MYKDNTFRYNELPRFGLSIYDSTELAIKKKMIEASQSMISEQLSWLICLYISLSLVARWCYKRPWIKTAAFFFFYYYHLKHSCCQLQKLVLRLAAVISWQRPLSTCVKYSLNTIKTPKFCIRCITIPSILNNWYCHSRIQSSTIIAFSLINEISHSFDTWHKILYFFYPASDVSLRHLG